jgi:DNA polymerase-3 subunit delta'
MWINVIGQQRAKSILSNSFERKRIAHAYLFHGQEGVGKDAAAVEFAMLINCESPVDGKEACGECRSCKDINTLKPPLIRFITALPTGKSESDDKDPLVTLDEEDAQVYLSELARKAVDKYHRINIPGANDIRISSIRLLKDQVSLTGYANKKKIFMISQADRMNQQSSNALLKILEEPPEDTVLILTTSRVNSLLPTIVGRCQLLKFDPLTEEEIFGYLESAHPELNVKDAKFFAALSQGSITNCREIMTQDYMDLRERVINFIASTITKRHLILGAEIDNVISKKDKQRIKRFLSLLAIWFRDVSVGSSGADEHVINFDKLDRLGKFSANYKSENFTIIKLIEEAILDVDRNIFPELLLTNLSIRIAGLIKSAT